MNCNGRIFVFKFKLQLQGDLLVNSELLDWFVPRVLQQFVHLVARGTHAIKFGFQSHDSFRCIIDHQSRIVSKT